MLKMFVRALFLLHLLLLPSTVLLLLAPRKSLLSVSASSTEHVIEETQSKNYTEDGTYTVKRDLSFEGKAQIFNSGPPEYVDRSEPWFRFAARRVVVRGDRHAKFPPALNGNEKVPIMSWKPPRDDKGAQRAPPQLHLIYLRLERSLPAYEIIPKEYAQRTCWLNNHFSPTQGSCISFENTFLERAPRQGYKMATIILTDVVLSGCAFG